MRIKTLYTIITYLSLLVFLMAIIPFLHAGIPTGHDILSHLIYLRKFQDAFFAGQFPVRFNDWFVPGLNQPLSNFYQPAFYYIFLIPRIIGIPNTESLKIVILGLWLLSGILMYLFTKRHFGHLGGILGAAFYMFAPYHIEDFVVRAAFSEFTALAFVPGIFWAIKAFWDTIVPYSSSDQAKPESREVLEEISSRQARTISFKMGSKGGIYLSLTSVFIALVVLSHPPTLIMYVPILVGYVGYLFFFCHSERSRLVGRVEESSSTHTLLKKIPPRALSGLVGMTYSIRPIKFLLSISLSSLLSLGLLSFFVLPALFEQKYIQIIFMRSGYYDFHNHFVCLSQLFVPNWGYGLSTNGCQDGMSFQIGLVHLLVVGMVVYFLVDRLLRKENPKEMLKRVQHDKLLLLFLSFLIFYVFMTLEISLPFWENLPLVPFIQYSWRFLAVIMFVIAFLAASIPGFFSPVIASDTRSLSLRGAKDERRSNPHQGSEIASLISFARNDKGERARNDKHKYLVFALLILLLPLFYAWYLHPLRYFQKNEVDFDSPKFLAGVKPETGNLLPETGYMPKWTEVLPPIEEIPENEAKILSGEPDITIINVIKVIAHRKEYAVTARENTKIRFYTHYFPGWKVYVDKKPIKFSYDNIYGYIETSLPKGKHNVVLSFEDTPVRTAGNLISLISLVGIVGLIGIPRSKSFLQ